MPAKCWSNGPGLDGASHSGGWRDSYNTQIDILGLCIDQCVLMQGQLRRPEAVVQLAIRDIPLATVGL